MTGQGVTGQGDEVASSGVVSSRVVSSRVVSSRVRSRVVRLAVGLVTVGLLAGCVTAEPDLPLATMGPEETSRLDEAGLERVRETGVLRLGLEELPLTWESVGLPADPSGGMVLFGSASAPEFELELVTDKGVLADRTSTLAVEGVADDVEVLRWRGSAGGDEEARMVLAETFELLGIAEDRLSFWWRSVERARETSDQRTLRLVIGHGYSPTGLVTWVEGTFNPESGNHVFQKVAVTDPRYYEPEILEEVLRQIEETGSFDVDDELRSMEGAG